MSSIEEAYQDAAEEMDAAKSEFDSMREQIDLLKADATRLRAQRDDLAWSRSGSASKRAKALVCWRRLESRIR